MMSGVPLFGLALTEKQQFSSIVTIIFGALMFGPETNGVLNCLGIVASCFVYVMVVGNKLARSGLTSCAFTSPRVIDSMAMANSSFGFALPFTQLLIAGCETLLPLAVSLSDRFLCPSTSSMALHTADGSYFVTTVMIASGDYFN
jgi:hypothetical protein